ncbi:hypothetical protein GC177_10800 [bacterium]|nr:hypothetical protein [bacterium]
MAAGAATVATKVIPAANNNFPVDQQVRNGFSNLENLYGMSEQDKGYLTAASETLGGSALNRILTSWSNTSNPLVIRGRPYVEAVYQFQLQQPITHTVTGQDGAPHETSIAPGTPEFNYEIVKSAIEGLQAVAYGTANAETPLSPQDRLETFLRFAEDQEHGQERAVEFLSEKLRAAHPDLNEAQIANLAQITFLENMVFFQEATTNQQGPEYNAVIGLLGGPNSPNAAKVFSAVSSITPNWQDIAEHLVGKDAKLFDPSGVHWPNNIDPEIAAQVRTEQTNNENATTNQQTMSNIMNRIMDAILGLINRILGGVLGGEGASAAATQGATSTGMNLDNEALSALRDNEHLTIPDGLDETKTIDQLNNTEIQSMIAANPTNGEFITSATRKMLQDIDPDEIAELVEFMRQQSQTSPQAAGYMLGAMIDSSIRGNTPPLNAEQLQQVFDTARGAANGEQFANYMISAMLESNRINDITIPAEAITSFINESLTQEKGFFAIAELINESNSADVVSTLAASNADATTLAKVVLNLAPEKLNGFLTAVGGDRQTEILTAIGAMSTDEIIASLRTANPQTLQLLSTQAHSEALVTAISTISQANGAAIPGVELGGSNYNITAAYNPVQQEAERTIH